MRSSLALTTLALATASSVQAIGIIDAVKTKVQIVSQAVTFDAGAYVVKNVATGQYLGFRRPADTTNLHTDSDYATVTLTHGGAKGMSGVNFGSYSGTIITGGNDKCGSAQWGLESGLGVNVAFVAYACTVGDNDVGTDTLEVAKQFWRIVPCGGDSSSSDSSSGVADTSSNVKLNVVASSDDNNDAATASFSSANSQATPTATSSDSASEDDSSTGYDLDAGFTPQATQEVVKSDRRTWTCQHSGKWLERHPHYITEAGHVECEDDLAAYKASLSKRSTTPSHSGMAKRLRARAASAGRYCIIAEDHLTDMTTRAVGSKVVDSFGGYVSQQLVNYDPTDKSQQWDIWAA